VRAEASIPSDNGNCGVRLAAPDEAVSLVLAHVHDERRAEAGKACSVFAPDARIDDAERASIEQPLRQILRREIAIRGKAIGEPVAAANVVELGAEVGEVIVVGDVLRAEIDAWNERIYPSLPKRQPCSVSRGSTTDTLITSSSCLSLRAISAREAHGQISATSR
jgi:hypothetical protein